jgi:hypothetical protein
MRPIRFGCGYFLLHLLAGTSAFAQSIAGAPAIASPIADAQRSSESACEQAGRQAERTHALPAGLLLAIGRVESGRWDAERRRVVPWPWAIDANGAGMLIDSKDAAIARTVALRDAGIRSVDVGCFQINLASHPLAFADLGQAFDPDANADYAGRFLVDLHARFGSWDSAIAAYHSIQPERGIPYRQRVFANWPLATRDTSADVQIGPLVVEFTSGAHMRIWTPGNMGVASEIVPITSAAPASLPRVIIGTPSPR